MAWLTLPAFALAFLVPAGILLWVWPAKKASREPQRGPAAEPAWKPGDTGKLLVGVGAALAGLAVAGFLLAAFPMGQCGSSGHYQYTWRDPGLNAHLHDHPVFAGDINGDGSIVFREDHERWFRVEANDTVRTLWRGSRESPDDAMETVAGMLLPLDWTPHPQDPASRRVIETEHQSC
ncbi:MAG: hypothetical protein QOD77_498 [Thermoplasmata archaeon]|nr:hypothetical protein [Thermoplasmata archaeon]